MTSQEQALDHVVEQIPIVGEDSPAGEILQTLRRKRFETIDCIYVVSRDYKPRGFVPIFDLLLASDGDLVRDIMRPIAVTASRNMDQEELAGSAIHHGVTSVPVVDKSGRLVGAVPSRAIIEILRREHVEDLHRLAGIWREKTQAITALEAPPLRRTRDRLPWLLAGLLGSSLATLIVSRFEASLHENIAIVFFIPAIVYLADAIGTQTEAIVVRGLSLEKLSLGKLFSGELRTGTLIGLVLGITSFPLVFIFLRDSRLAFAVATAIFIAGAIATSLGLLLPWILSKAGRDPAFGSGPLGTVIQDISSLAVYFLVAQLLL